MDYATAWDLCNLGFNNWKNKEHNKKWFKLIDGTPIPNDLLVNIALALVENTVLEDEYSIKD